MTCPDHDNLFKMAIVKGERGTMVLLFVFVFLVVVRSQLCDECSCLVESITCRNVFIMPALRHALKRHESYQQATLDVRHCQGSEELKPDLVERVFPKLKSLFLGEREHCYPSATYNVYQFCPGGKF